jgi:tRNA (guanosine-2'-O-)-methyltransferase
VGNEVTGVSEELSAMADLHFEIPMRGVKQSLNVSVATGVVGYELARCCNNNY